MTSHSKSFRSLYLIAHEEAMDEWRREKARAASRLQAEWKKKLPFSTIVWHPAAKRFVELNGVKAVHDYEDRRVVQYTPARCECYFWPATEIGNCSVCGRFEKQSSLRTVWWSDRDGYETYNDTCKSCWMKFFNAKRKLEAIEKNAKIIRQIQKEIINVKTKNNREPTRVSC